MNRNRHTGNFDCSESGFIDWQRLARLTASPPWDDARGNRRMPLGSRDRPGMKPPALDALASADAPGPMHWWDGSLDLPGFAAHWFDTGEVTLYLVTGPDNGKTPLLLLPGQVEPWHSYRPSLDGLKDEFRLIIMELRGHGYSERVNDGGYRVVDYVRDTEAVIRHFIGEKALVSGNSLGGMMVIAMGQLCPELMLGAFIEDAPYTIVGERDWMSSSLQAALFYPDQLAARAIQEGGMSVIEAARIYSEAPMFTESGEGDSREGRRKFVAMVMERGLGKLLDKMPASESSRYRAAWEFYVETGRCRRRIDHLPFVATDLSRHSLVKTDWRAPDTMVQGRWMDGFDEDTALRGLTMPTVFWEADVDLSPLHTRRQREHTLAVVAEPERKFRHVYAEGCPHIAHNERPDVYVPTIVEFFEGIERAGLDD